MDITIVIIALIYFAITLLLGFWVARKEKNNPDDYFLAGRRLPWYAVSMSMTGSNIGTEHFIGMVGTAYAFGLAPATFEWGNFIPYSILLWIFLPYFYRKKLYTIPEFLERRYSPVTRSVFALFTLSHMVLAVLVPALYAGGRILYEMTLQTEVTTISIGFVGCILIIAGVTAAYCIYGGLLSVVWTDVMQVIILLLGGFLLLWLGMQDAGGFQNVIEKNLAHDPDRFRLILPTDHPVSPWTGVATFWFTLSLWYVGTNQFYIQRCLGAKSEWDAKMGVIGCAMLKILLPIIIVFPGLVAFAQYGTGMAEDAVYVHMINDLLPPIGRGILLAALIAAIMSTVSSVLNSSSTIWSMDIHKRYINTSSSDEKLVKVGRWTSFVVIMISIILSPFLLWWQSGIFIYIQEMAAFFAPPISVIFLAAYLWPKAHGRAATATLLMGIVIGLALMIIGQRSADAYGWLEPLLNRAAISWVFCLLVLVLSTYFIPKAKKETYDPDIIWNRKWAELPANEKPLNRGMRNLLVWWIIMMVLSTSLFLLFR